MPRENKSIAHSLHLETKGDLFLLVKDPGDRKRKEISLSMQDLIALERIVHSQIIALTSKDPRNPLAPLQIPAAELRGFSVAPDLLNSAVILALTDDLNVTLRYVLSAPAAHLVADDLKAVAGKIQGGQPPTAN